MFAKAVQYLQSEQHDFTKIWTSDLSDKYDSEDQVSTSAMLCPTLKEVVSKELVFTVQLSYWFLHDIWLAKGFNDPLP